VPADEALTLYRALGRQADSLMAGYWLAYARYQTGDTHGARALLARMLADLDVPSTQAPADLRIRVLIALGSVATDQGDHAHAVGWLDEARTLSDGLDDRRRASLLSMIATSRAATGDVDGAVRAGVESLALYRSVEARHEAAVIENNLALAWLQAGDVERAREYAACARRRHEVEGDHVSLAHVIETEARIALLDQQPEDALRLASESERLARTSGNGRALTSSLVTSAQALVALERPVDAVTAYQEAIDLLRTHGSAPTLRAALTGLADLMATLGRHREAFELTREALSTTVPSGARPGTAESARPAPVASPASA
jgi:tetratricopeptide (TPR) repeat protein